MNSKKVRRAGRRIQLRRLAKRFKESGAFDPAVFESRSQSSDPPQDVTAVTILFVKQSVSAARENAPL